MGLVLYSVGFGTLVRAPELRGKQDDSGTPGGEGSKGTCRMCWAQEVEHGPQKMAVIQLGDLGSM